MKRLSTITRLAFTLALATGLTGCIYTDDDADDQPPTCLNVDAEISQQVLETPWYDNAHIGITMFKHGTFTLADGNHNNKTYVKTLRSEDSFGPLDESHEIYFPQNGSLVDFMAYYPYSVNMTQSFVMPLAVSDQSDLSKIDFMTGQQHKTEGYSKADYRVKFNFSHRLTKVMIKLITPEGVDPTKLVGSTITIEGMYTRGNYQLNNNTLGVEPELTSKANILLRTNPTTGATAEAIVFPRPAGEGVAFKVVFLDGSEFRAFMKQDLALLAGNQYLFEIRLHKTPIEVGADILPWKDGGESDLDGK